MANGVSGDGSRICGTLDPGVVDSEKSPLAIPVIWELQSNGTYSEPIILPHPETDWKGECPHSVTAITISEDGNTIVGQVKTPICSGDLSMICLDLDSSDTGSGGLHCSFILPIRESSDTKNIIGDNDSRITALKDGKLILNGDFTNVSIYDTSGQLVFSANPTSNIIQTGLTNGVYIIKAHTYKDVMTLKAIF